ncbi:MAG: response regulator, partial [Terriglobus roseus]|nr:response regulator [Terriglobus roseus]
TPDPATGLKKTPITVESPPELDQHTDLPTADLFSQSAQRFSGGSGSPRKQSLFDEANAHAVQALLQGDTSAAARITQPHELASVAPAAKPQPGMLHRKVWVRRPGASATLVQVREDDLVDDVRDHILRKYGNSLGRSFDAPDLTIKIVSRAENGQKHHERTLGPEEEMWRAIELAFPGGQTVDEALLIDIPHKRTPKPSPRAHYSHYHEETARPLENGGDYFPPMPPAGAVSPGNMTNASHHSSSHNNSSHNSHGNHEHARAMSVLNTGQVPPLPSPGGSRRLHHRSNRPNYVRQHTSSPTTLTAPSNLAGSKPRPRLDSSASDHRQIVAPTAPLIPEPSTQTHEGTVAAPVGGQANTSLPATPRVSSPGPRRSKKRAKPQPEQPAAPTTTLGLDTSVPPINVLIVEDNPVNLRLLEQFIRRLKVRWATAVNGREAVNKWREGGFHLVLMDIQLPIMSGLEATREIRRLERVNNIGVFSSSSASNEAPNLLNGNCTLADDKGKEKVAGEDQLDVQRLFKSPVIIVA